MEKLVIRGGRPLHGHVRVSSAKNAVLPIIVAALLPESPSTIIDAPELDDVRTICSVLESLGAGVEKTGNKLIFDASTVDKTEASYELMSRMRASFLIMGPLLAKKGHARIARPGGCMIGSRPIDLHLKAFEAMGAKINVGNDYVEGYAPEGGLKGADIYLDFPSVGATENILMAAVLADGKTVIENAAEEPEIVDLVTFLTSMGANIKGAGTNVIRVEGVKSLKGASHIVIPDRIEAGTFMIAAAMAGGDVVVDNVVTEHLKPLLAKLAEAGVKIIKDVDSVRIISDGHLKSTDIKTLPYPGFPTDLQAQFMALMTISEGVGTVTETVFENRFMHVGELRRMGANIEVEGRKATVRGVPFLEGAFVRATDLRAGAALALAGLVAHGVTEVGDLHHIDRGYDHLVEKLQGLGADIVRVDKD